MPNWVPVVGAFLLAWAVLSFPAYLLEAFVRKARERLTAFAQALAIHFHGRTVASSSTSPFHLFLSSHRFRAVSDENSVRWTEAVTSIGGPIAKLTGTISQASDAVSQSRANLIRLTKQLDRIASSNPSTSGPIEIGRPPETSLEDVKTARRAWVNLTVSITFIVALVFVNTGMLSQIFQSVLEFGAIKIIGEVRLYHFLALFATLFEAGLGVLHATVGADDKVHAERALVPKLLVTSGVVALGLVEGFFYSRLGVGTQSFSLLGFTLGMDQAFFIMGFVLPLTLAGLGNLFYKSLTTVNASYAIAHLDRRLRGIRTLQETLSHSVDATNAALSVALERGRSIVAVMPQHSAVREQELAAVLRGATDELERIRRAKPEWATIVASELNDKEVRQQGLRSGAWLILTFLVMALSVRLESALIGASLYGYWIGWAAASAQVVVLLSAGLLFKATPIVVEEGLSLRPVGSYRSSVARVLALAIIIAILGHNLYLAIEHRSTGEGVAWTVVLTAGVSLVALGGELPSSLAISVGVWKLLGRTLTSVWQGLLLGALHLLRGVFLLLEFFLGLLAIPARLVIDLRSRKGLAA